MATGPGIQQGRAGSIPAHCGQKRFQVAGSQPTGRGSLSRVFEVQDVEIVGECGIEMRGGEPQAVHRAAKWR